MRECSGSLRMVKRQSLMAVVMILSTKKILRQEVTDPMGWMESKLDASRPPTLLENQCLSASQSIEIRDMHMLQSMWKPGKYELFSYGNTVKLCYQYTVGFYLFLEHTSDSTYT